MVFLGIFYKITKGEIIAEYCNFQNLDDVQKSFSFLFNFNFYEELKKYKWIYDAGDSEGFTQLDKDFYIKLKRLIDLRHNFVHDINFNTTLSMNQIENFHDESIYFAHQVERFLSDLLSK